jgi:hypothetical protein
VTRLVVPSRALLLVAGMPGAGKSTLLRTMPARPGLRVLDSDAYRCRMAAAIGTGMIARIISVPYAWYRPVVHAWHRLAVVAAAFSATPTVVVHLPATAAHMRAAVAVLAALTRRSSHLVWLHVDPEDALRGQRERGRVVPSASFMGHVRRAAATSARLRAGRGARGWTTVTVLDRTAARSGLRVETEPAPVEPAPVERARTRPQ